MDIELMSSQLIDAEGNTIGESKTEEHTEDLDKICLFMKRKVTVKELKAELRRCQELWGITEEDAAKILDCDKKMYNWFMNGGRAIPMSETTGLHLRLLQHKVPIIIAMNDALSIVYNNSDIKEFLRSQHPFLKEKRPLDILMGDSHKEKWDMYNKFYGGMIDGNYS